MWDLHATRLLVGAIALRCALVLLGVGEYLQWRVEVSTPANSLASVRECLMLGPGSQCRTPPLVLNLHAWTANHQHLYAVPNIVLDALAGLMLRQVAAMVLPQDQPTGARMTPNAVMGLFLLNPMTVAACVAGTTSSAEVCVCMALLWLAARRGWVGASAALAVAVYMGLHASLLLVPAAMMLMSGPEANSPISLEEDSVTGNHSIAGAAEGQQAVAATPGAAAKHGAEQATVLTADTSQSRLTTGHDIDNDVTAVQAPVPSTYLGRVLGTLLLASLSLAQLTLLALWSDRVVAGLRPSAACAPHVQQLVRSGVQAVFLGGPWRGSASMDECWAHTVYRLHVLVEDQTPNIGQLWYLFTEMFTPYLALFRFVAHSLAAILVVPLAIRFPRRPVFLFTIQCLITCMFKPYPSVADHALYMALLPLLTQQMALLQNGMLLGNSFLLLAVLEGSMWHQWINIESANSNFYYSITLLIGAWQTLLVVQLCLLTVRADKSTKQRQML